MQRKQAGLEMPEYLLRHDSPLRWQHILLIGQYIWRKRGRLREKAKKNTPLRISPVPFHDVENGCFTNPEVSGDPAVTSAFFGGLNDFGSNLV